MRFRGEPVANRGERGLGQRAGASHRSGVAPEDAQVGKVGQVIDRPEVLRIELEHEPSLAVIAGEPYGGTAFRVPHHREPARAIGKPGVEPGKLLAVGKERGVAKQPALVAGLERHPGAEVARIGIQDARARDRVGGVQTVDERGAVPRGGLAQQPDTLLDQRFVHLAVGDEDRGCHRQQRAHRKQRHHAPRDPRTERADADHS